MGFIFQPIIWKIVIGIFFIVIIVSLIQYNSNLRNYHLREATGDLVFIFEMICCTDLAAKILFSCY